MNPTTPMPRYVDISFDQSGARHFLTLNLPEAFGKMTKTSIHRVFRMMKEHPWKTESTRQTLDQFFPAWREKLQDDAANAEAAVTEAEKDAENKKRAMEALGSALNEDIKREKEKLTCAKRKKMMPYVIAERKAAVEMASRPITDYQMASKEVKRQKGLLREAQAMQVRCDKIAGEYGKLKEYLTE